MRILYVTARFPVLSETFVINQAAGMVARGHDVTIYAIGGRRSPGPMHADVGRYGLDSRTLHGTPVPASPIARIASAARLLRGVDDAARRRALRLVDVFRHGREALSLHLLHRAAGLLAIPGGRRFDVVHCQFGDVALAALDWMAAGLIEGRLVTTFRGFDLSSFVRTHGEGVYSGLFRRGDAFLTVCEFLRRRLVALGCDPSRLAVLFSGIDARRFAFRARAPRPDGSVRLITVGRLVEKKGIEFALEAIATLVGRGLDLNYDVIGEGPLGPALQARVAALGLAARVRFHGALAHEALVAVLGEADLFVAANVTAADGDQEGLVNALKEAMASGMPVVATRHGGILELVEDGVSGLLVPERDAAALADALAGLCAAPARWAALGRAGRVRMEAAFALESLNDELERVYRRVVTGSAVSAMPVVRRSVADIRSRSAT